MRNTIIESITNSINSRLTTVVEKNFKCWGKGTEKYTQNPGPEGKTLKNT